MTRCNATSKNGRRCRSNCVKGSKKCFVHFEREEDEKIERIYSPQFKTFHQISSTHDITNVIASNLYDEYRAISNYGFFREYQGVAGKARNINGVIFFVLNEKAALVFSLRNNLRYNLLISMCTRSNITEIYFYSCDRYTREVCIAIPDKKILLGETFNFDLDSFIFENEDHEDGNIVLYRYGVRVGWIPLDFANSTTRRRDIIPIPIENNFGDMRLITEGGKILCFARNHMGVVYCQYVSSNGDTNIQNPKLLYSFRERKFYLWSIESGNLWEFHQMERSEKLEKIQEEIQSFKKSRKNEYLSFISRIAKRNSVVFG